MQTLLAAENEETVGRPPFHLRNGDVVVWTDVSWRPTAKHIAMKQEKDKEDATKQSASKKKRTKRPKGTTSTTRRMAEPQGLVIKTYEEYMAEQAEKAEKEKNNVVDEEQEKQKGDGVNVDNEGTTKSVLTKSDKAKMFDVMVAENAEDLHDPKPKTQRHNSF